MYNPPDSFPYIGLRPFSEEDSLYFKGRDEQIQQLTSLLEANKFLMVTGASGDGKSSLVYAGLVPNARAGFFRAQYTRWVVADFRPERSPVKNLGKTIARNLGIEDEETAEIELRRGFSSLIELYQTSSLYVDEQGAEWKNADEDARDGMQRKAANLLIVADQFEEFFTNPENYYKNSPSADSQLVINLLLETARISISKRLPIYIVCTMRSDYIGQCAAFRGLPEFIGFSQFFVPRLKRKEMLQVVKEPAALHGDKISNRLVERVVFDLGEGIDQLPVLEHAMNEVWIQAKNGQEEMDLIHYAMAGGMPPNELPVEDRKSFKEWFETLPQKLKDAYQHTGLSHIIDTHANKLFLSAADHYNQSHSKKISTDDAQLIIKTAFTCLTKMDDGRAVRNRMTLQEITDILARPNLTTEIVGGVLNIFREPGNTFLRPYISGEPESQNLQPDSVLDITHESLIRNWELLLIWAQEEYDHLVVYEDFKKQLDRWSDSNKSRGFLLPIGPLTFFEDWHNKLNPNKHWINRYLDPGTDKEIRLRESQQIIDNTNEFLRRSANKVRITRLIVKYGATRIAVAFGSIAILLLCGFYYRDAQLKKNENVVEKVVAEGSQYISDPRFDGYMKSDFLAMAEFIEPGSFKKTLDNIPFEQKSELIRHTYSTFMMHGGDPPLKRYCLYYGDSIIMAEKIREDEPDLVMAYFRTLNVLVMTTSHYLYNQNDSRLELVKQHALEKTKEILPLVFQNQYPLEKMDMATINDGIQNLLNNHYLNKTETEEFLALISPYESEQAKKTFDLYFPANQQVQYNRNNKFRHNGGYQELAYLYASIGDLEKVKMSVDSLLKYHRNYSQFVNGINNIGAYLIKAHAINKFDNLLQYYAGKTGEEKRNLYESCLDVAGQLDYSLDLKIRYSDENHNPNIELMDYESVNALFGEYLSVLMKSFREPNDLNYNLALYYKQYGIILDKINTDKNGIYTPNTDSLFALALKYFMQVPENYLNQPRRVFYFALGRNLRNWTQRRAKDLFIYPDHFPKTPYYRRSPSRYYSNAFLAYTLKEKAFNELYTEAQDFELIREWLTYYDWGSKTNFDYRLMLNHTILSEDFLTSLDSTMSSNPQAKNVNSNRLRLILIDEYIEKDEEEKLNDLYKKLDFNKFKENFNIGLGQVQESFVFHMYRLAEYFALKGRKQDAIKLIQSLTNRPNYIRFYSLVPLKLIMSDQPDHKEDIFIYLDSAITEFDRLQDFLFFDADPRIAMVLTPALIGGKDMNDLALKYVRSINLDSKGGVMNHLIQGIAMQGNYYQAYDFIPEISLIDRLSYFNSILSTEGLKRTSDPEWKTYFYRYQNYWIWEFIGYEPDVL